MNITTNSIEDMPKTMGEAINTHIKFMRDMDLFHLFGEGLHRGWASHYQYIRIITVEGVFQAHYKG